VAKFHTLERMTATDSKNFAFFKYRMSNGIALHGKPISELRSVTCHMASHAVTCHLTQVNALRHVPSNLPTAEGWKAELVLVIHVYQDGLSVCI